MAKVNVVAVQELESLLPTTVDNDLIAAQTFAAEINERLRHNAKQKEYGVVYTLKTITPGLQQYDLKNVVKILQNSFTTPYRTHYNTHTRKFIVKWDTPSTAMTEAYMHVVPRTSLFHPINNK